VALSVPRPTYLIIPIFAVSNVNLFRIATKANHPELDGRGHLLVRLYPKPALPVPRKKYFYLSLFVLRELFIEVLRNKGTLFPEYICLEMV
jgi:hypothetical protein